MSDFEIQQCKLCGRCWFPERLRCPHCGSRAFGRIAAGPGTVQEVTGRPEAPERLGSIRLDAGPAVIAALKNGIDPGARVAMEADRGRLVAHRAP
jgi:uncharacterized OB-fold protein